MNLTLSVPEEIAARAKEVAARQGQSLSAWFRQQVDREAEALTIAKIEKMDPEIAQAIGSGLPLEEHWDDERWRNLVTKHLK